MRADVRLFGNLLLVEAKIVSFIAADELAQVFTIEVFLQQT